MKINRILGSVFLLHFLCFSLALQYHHGRHWGEHNHGSVALPSSCAHVPTACGHLAEASRSSLSAAALDKHARHAFCFLCYISAVSQAAPSGQGISLHAETHRAAVPAVRFTFPGFFHESISIRAPPVLS